MAKSPVNFSKVTEAWKESLAAAARSAGIVLGGDDALVNVAQERFASSGTLPATWTRPLTELSGFSSMPGELLVVFLTSDSEQEALVALESDVPKGGVVLAVDEGVCATGEISYPHEGVVRLSFADTPSGWRRLFGVCADLAGEHIVALGRRYPALRRQAARKVIYKNAAQNALIGALFFVPGADMPAMTLNQGRMLLSLAGIYGISIDKERAVELAALVGAGFGLRALARSFVRSAPGVGWAVKASTGFTGTVALGYAVMRYFEMGAPAATGKVIAVAGRLRR